MKPITEKQRRVLRRMVELKEGHYSPGQVGTNASCLLALERRGLVSIYRGVGSWFRSYEFMITNAGRRATA